MSCSGFLRRARTNRRVRVAVASPFLGLVGLLFLWLALFGLILERNNKKMNSHGILIKVGDRSHPNAVEVIVPNAVEVKK